MAYADPEVGKRKSRERFRARMAERRASGLCLGCGAVPPAPGRTNCEPCSEKRRAREKERSARLKAEGKPRRDLAKAREAGRRHYRKKVETRVARNLCPRCGLAPPAPDRRLCDGCNGKIRDRARVRYHEGKQAGLKYGGRPAESRRRSARVRSERKRLAWLEAGKCSRCGKAEPAEGGSTCTPCRTRRQERERAKYAKRRSTGCCVRCAASTFDGAALCFTCAAVEADSGRQERKNAASRRRYMDRRRAGICTDCGAPSNGASRCVPCAHRSYTRSAHFRGMPAWEPEYTVVDLDTGEEHGPFDSRADADAGAAFLKLRQGRFEVVAENHPLAGSVGWA